jgi:hypothetical protein
MRLEPRTSLRSVGVVAILVFSYSAALALGAQSSFDANVVVIGGTPGGVMAAIAAARCRESVLLVDRSRHLGGLVANGLGATDIATRGATGGLFLDFVNRVLRHYVETYGAGSQQVRDCSEGYHFEPSVGEQVIAAMVKEHPNILVLTDREFDANPRNVTLQGGKILGLSVNNRESGLREEIRGSIFVDATYEGDLAAAAGVPYTLGREDRRETNEPRSGQLYAPWGGQETADSTGRGDNAVQSYNYRIALTSDPANRVSVERPAGYRREDYSSLVDDIRVGRTTRVAGSNAMVLEQDGIGRVVNMVRLPNNKFDANNQHISFLSTDLPEENWPWPTSSWAWRDAFALRLKDYTLGLLWFCQNDPELPAEFRARCLNWGLARDEYADNGHFPRQVYVREGRRIHGAYIFSAFDALPTGPGLRPPIHADSVTSSHYSLDSHAVRKREPNRANLDGFFSMPTAPYTVPYGVIVPEKVDNLLVPVAASATHVGFSTLRMEPCWMALGEAAGVAAHLALASNLRPRDVEVRILQNELLENGAILIYLADIHPGSPHFKTAEILALDGLITGWSANFETPITLTEAKKWSVEFGVPARSDIAQMSRGDFAGLFLDGARSLK